MDPCDEGGLEGTRSLESDLLLLNKAPCASEKAAPFWNRGRTGGKNQDKERLRGCTSVFEPDALFSYEIFRRWIAGQGTRQYPSSGDTGRGASRF